MNKKNQFILFFLSLFLLGLTSLAAQDAVTLKPSPLAMSAVKQGDTYIKVTYSQPHKRDREIFGNLVKFGEVWRTGANEATEITFSSDVTIAGKNVVAGTYSLFTIPNENKWTIILNTDLGLWGAFNYKEANDVLRTDVMPESTGETVWEPFTIKLSKGDAGANLELMWDTTKVVLPIETM